MIFPMMFADSDSVLGSMCGNSVLVIIGIFLVVKWLTKQSTTVTPAAPAHESAPTKGLAATVATGVLVGLIKAGLGVWLGHHPHHDKHS